VAQRKSIIIRGNRRADPLDGEAEEDTDSSGEGLNSIRFFKVASTGLNIHLLRDEIDDMMAVMLGRVEPPIKRGIHTLQEVSDAYYARAAEITIEIMRLESEGNINKGDPLYKFRTGELRTFMELVKRSSELGSRRLTYEQFMWDSKHDSDGFG
jgi:hypothetical protein